MTAPQLLERIEELRVDAAQANNSNSHAQIFEAFRRFATAATLLVDKSDPAAPTFFTRLAQVATVLGSLPLGDFAAIQPEALVPALYEPAGFTMGEAAAIPQA
jgi:hypothetical protein